MRIVIPTTGSRGDVQPYVALGVGLRRAGHDVRLATHADFEPLARRHGLDFFAIEADARALQATAAGRKMVASGDDPFTYIRQYVRLRQPLMHGLMHNCHQACQDADLVVVCTTGFFLAYAAAEKLRLPTFAASYLPMSATRFLPNCLAPEAPAWLPWSGLYNLLSHFVIGEFFWQTLRESVNRARREVLGLPPLPFLGPPPRLLRERPAVYGCSRAVVPRPPDWTEQQQVTGYWFLDEPDARLPEKVTAFLEAGPPPVYVGFGSMHNHDPEAVTDLVTRALERCGRRGILHAGWDGLGRRHSSEHLFVEEPLAHELLLPHVAAVVHHGGAGTTAAALRAGVPSVVVPYMADQPFWASRVFRLGAGPRPIPRKRLSVGRLAEAVEQAVSDPDMRRRAAVLGRQIRAEDGVAEAVAVIERHQRLRKDLPHTAVGSGPHFRSRLAARDGRARV
jgi:UDP:flavonoid glycosyltransferase YjiC (YdhE family)